MIIPLKLLKCIALVAISMFSVFFIYFCCNINIIKDQAPRIDKNTQLLQGFILDYYGQHSKLPQKWSELFNSKTDNLLSKQEEEIQEDYILVPHPIPSSTLKGLYVIAIQKQSKWQDRFVIYLNKDGSINCKIFPESDILLLLSELHISQ